MSSADVVRRRLRRLWLWPLILFLLLLVAAFAAYELIASPIQAMVLADYGKRLTFQLEASANAKAPLSPRGPYDVRLGYPHLPDFISRLQRQGFEVTQQARVSAGMLRINDLGLFMPYHEKSVAGLTLLDCGHRPLLAQRFPRHTYTDFDAIPPVIANTLLFIENRELLDPNHPQRNPAVEWDRLVAAVLEKALQTIDPSRNVPGGSTLATQIEKYRHSPDGLTLTALDKLRQMASASLRAYRDGPDTLATRRRIVLDYLNTVPLAAAPRIGEVNGIGDGLVAWFGLDFTEVNRLLRNPDATPEAARAFKHVLALLISQRKPSYYLLSGHEQLNAQADAHLRLLASAKVITPRFRDAALRQHLRFRGTQRTHENGRYADKKAVNALRVELMERLNVPRLYELDRLDLTARATLHGPTQKAVSHFLQRLSDPAVVEAAGLYGHSLLAPEDDLDKPIYSFTLYENTADGALLRVQADNLNQPFDINQGAKLDMGSSAKLRTLITYLQVVAELHAQYAGLSRVELLRRKVADKDLLTRWAVDYLTHAQDKGLMPMLRAAMARPYSASPAESFFTGGGVHRFSNFSHDDDQKVMDLWEATRNSVNLPFIRLMRDIVRHFMYRDPKGAAQILDDPRDPRRSEYLRRFADQEGKAYLARFHKKYKGLKPDEATAILLNHLTANPKRLAAVFRYLEPRADIATFTRFLKGRLSNPAGFAEGDFQYLYETYGPEKFSLSDRGYIAQVHPLELWLVAHLRAQPQARWDEIVKASLDERVEVYAWLLKTSHKNAQDIRILSLLEIEAFQEVHRRWRMLGYPFGSLVPSYATAIGSSADRPAALAELMGVIVNDGVKLPPVTLTDLEFARDTPYHTRLKRRRPEAQRIFPQAIAVLVKEALTNVVEKGTARRLRGSFPLGDGRFLPLGGKTGTGDHRFEVYAANGTVLESKVMNRTATFAFFMGDRFFGVMTVFVPGEAAAGYHFTSGLAVQVMKDMEPALRPLVLGSDLPEPDWEEALRAFSAGEGDPVPPPRQAPEPTAGGKAEAIPPPASDAGVPPPQEAQPPREAPTLEPAPAPPQVDMPDPAPPPEPAPAPSRQERPPEPWSPSQPTGSGFQFF
ncbi:MAG TPA: transglycosylase domain-containing protein [Thiobacillaceae bacterium]|nr:transglycosylase domain-containing protein [Thiobacillaceae bacterium]HNU64300.1 transglycosylase domain-containing protein [Thiobacillaceae bacterium]